MAQRLDYRMKVSIYLIIHSTNVVGYLSFLGPQLAPEIGKKFMPSPKHTRVSFWACFLVMGMAWSIK